MQEYYNYLSTPSGLECNLKEMTNREYLILLKFLNGENYKGFYGALDSLLRQSITNFDSMNLIDKAYIYIANYYYSVKSDIAVKGEIVDTVDLPLIIFLNELEESYNKELMNHNVMNFKCLLHYPTQLLFDSNDNIDIDFSSSIRQVGNEVLNLEQSKTLAKMLPLKYLNEIIAKIKEKYNTQISISKGIKGVKEMKDNLLNSSIFYSIAYIYKDSLENFYNMQYMITHYIRVDWQSLLNMTPVELSILYKNFIEDKERQNESAKNNNRTGVLNSLDPNTSDLLGGI